MSRGRYFDILFRRKEPCGDRYIINKQEMVI